MPDATPIAAPPKRRRLYAFLNYPCGEHPLGLFVAILFLMAMEGSAGAATMIPVAFGYIWQCYFVSFAPFACALSCMFVFVAVPVGNHSRYAVIRGIGQIPVLGRYLIFGMVGLCATLLLAMWLHLLFSSSVGSLQLFSEVSIETSSRIERGLGERVVLSSSPAGTYIYFLKERQAAVESALRKDNVAFKQ